MTRSELIQVVSMKQDQLSIKEVERAIKSLFDQIVEVLGEGRRIEIRGLGTFTVRFRQERLARNPKTGVKVRKEARYSLHFKPGKEMRERVAQNRESI